MYLQYMTWQCHADTVRAYTPKIDSVVWMLKDAYLEIFTLILKKNLLPDTHFRYMQMFDDQNVINLCEL